MLSSTGGPSSVSSMSSHNMKGGGSGTAINPAIPSSSTLNQSHPSPMDHRNSKFGGQGNKQSSSTYKLSFCRYSSSSIILSTCNEWICSIESS